MKTRKELAKILRKRQRARALMAPNHYAYRYERYCEGDQKFPVGLRKRCRSVGVVKSRYSIDCCGHACSEGEGYAEENQSNDYAKRQARHETNFRHVFFTLQKTTEAALLF